MVVVPNEIFFAEVEHLLSEGNDVFLVVFGNSMRPLMRSGRTKVMLRRCDAGELRCGDVVLFRYRGRHTLHRIVKRRDDEFLLAGDGNYRGFETCRGEDVVARVVKVVSYGGREVLCDSRLWRWSSGCWLWLHPFVRRCILGVMRRLGI